MERKIIWSKKELEQDNLKSSAILVEIPEKSIDAFE
jgi:hypothetical protein